MPNNKWYVITGGPSSGKTTLLSRLEEMGHAVVPEAARTFIDQELSKGLTLQQVRADNKKFQEEVARLKIAIEKSLDKNILTFFDRGMHDSIAYLRQSAHGIEDWIKKASQFGHYQKVFLLDQLPTYEADYARTESDTEAQEINQLLFDAYSEAGMEPVRVPVMSVDDRLKFILKHAGELND